ncbi:unnamed protein product, partial [Amoebophrya sp. A25]
STVARYLRDGREFVSVDTFHLTFEYTGLQGHHVELHLNTLAKLGAVKHMKQQQTNRIFNTEEGAPLIEGRGGRRGTRPDANQLLENGFGIMSDRMTTLLSVPLCRIPEVERGSVRTAAD